MTAQARRHRVLRGLAVVVPFVAAYILGVGGITFFNIAVLGMIDPKFAHSWFYFWWTIYWPLWAVFYAPAAAAAVAATWYSRRVGWSRQALLGGYLVLIAVTMEAAWLMKTDAWPLEVLALSAVLVAIARAYRVRPTPRT